jgi:hypothetical protein
MTSTMKKLVAALLAAAAPTTVGAAGNAYAGPQCSPATCNAGYKTTRWFAATNSSM